MKLKRLTELKIKMENTSVIDNHAFNSYLTKQFS